MFQALSEYGYQSAVEREQLVSDLLFHLGGLQVGDDGFETQLDSTLRSLNHHKFMDVNPSEVDDLYGRLQDRLAEFAQFDKARALRLLHRVLAGAQLPSEQYDFNHKVLAFMYSASRGALDSQFAGSDLVDKLLGDVRSVDKAKATYLSDESSDSEWESQAGQPIPGGTASEGSSLSDWGEDPADLAALAAEEEGGAGEGGEGEGGAAQCGEAGAAGAAGQTKPGPGTPSPARARPAGQSVLQHVPRPVAPLKESPYQRDSLAVWLAAKQSGGQPARLLNPQLCLTEGGLLQQVLHMLKGVSQPGLVFQLDPVRGTYSVQPGVHMHCTSAAATRALLQRFADLGSQLRAVHEFCNGVLHAGSVAGGPAGGGEQQQEEEIEGRLRQLPTVAAFAAAVASQLNAMQQQLIPLEVAARAGALTLLQLHHQLEGQRRLAAVLHAACRQCMWRGSAAESSGGLLDALHDMVQREMMTAASQGGALAAMLLQIFLATAKPYLDKLHSWAFSGDLRNDTVEELCVAADPSIPPTSSKFWTSAYSIRRTSSGAPAVPSFLLPLAGSLLAAGKSAVLLGASPAQASLSLRGSEPAAPAAAATGELRLPLGSHNIKGGQRGNLLATVSYQPGDRLPLLSPGANSRTGAVFQTSQQQHHHQQQRHQQQGARRPESPTKRRLSTIQALGYAVATSEAAERHSFGGPAAAAAASGERHLMAATVEGEEGNLGGSSLLQPLHEHFVGRLQQLMPPWPSKPAAEPVSGRCSPSSSPAELSPSAVAQPSSTDPAAAGGTAPQGRCSSQLQAGLVGAETAAGAEAVAEAAAEAARDAGAALEEESWLATSAACNSTALSLAPEDDLPALPSLPRTALQLHTPRAVIAPEALPAAEFLAVALGSAAAATGAYSSNASRQQLGSQQEQAKQQQLQQQQPQQQGEDGLSTGGALSMGDRMRQAALQRVRQASGEGCTLDLLPALQPPAALGQVPPAVGVLNGGQPSEEGPSQAMALATPDFNNSSWAAWHRRVSHALSSQLEAIDAGLGAGLLPGAANGLLAQGCGGWWQQAPRLQQEHSHKLSPAMCTHARPLDSLLQQCLLSPLQLQARRIEAALAASLLQRLGLLEQLHTLREVFLLGSPLMEPLLHSLFLKISSRQGIDGVTEFDLNSALQQSFLAEGRTDLLSITAAILPKPSDHSPAGVDSGSGTGETQQQQQQQQQQGQQGHRPTLAGTAAATAAAGAGAGQLGMPTVHTLSRLQLKMECGYPLCLLVSEEALQQYNAGMVLLMQLRWVKRSLDSLQRSKWKKLRPSSGPGSSSGATAAAAAGLEGRRTSQRADNDDDGDSDGDSTTKQQQPVRRGGALRRVVPKLGERDGVLQQMAHLVDAVLQYTGERLLAAWQWLQEALVGCHSLDELQRCHAKYLRAVQRYSLLGQDTLARLVHSALLRLLDCALHYCLLSSQAARAPAESKWAGPAAAAARQRGESLREQLSKVGQEFSSRQRLLVKVLASRAREVGGQADEMRHLLAAMDFNGFFQQAVGAGPMRVAV